MAAHHLDHDHALVRFRRVAQPVDILQSDIRRRVEAEGVVGQAQVVVHRLWDADRFYLMLMVQLRRHSQRIVAADGDQRVDLELLQVLQHRVALRFVAGLERVCPRRAQNRAALADDRLDYLKRQRHGGAFDQSRPAARETDNLVPEIQQAHRRTTDRGVQAGAVAAAGEHSNSHLVSPKIPLWFIVRQTA